MSYIWRNRPEPIGEEAQAADDAIDAAATGRLRRVVGRVERAEAPAAPSDTMPGGFAGIPLACNAFALLGTSIDASAEAVNEAVDNLSFEPGSDPEALNGARARLMSARDRLGEELGWLPELSPSLLASVRIALAAGDVAAIAAARDATIGLARFNLSLALAAACRGDAERAARVVTDAQSLDADAVEMRLGEARAQSGFRPIEREVYDRALLDRARAAARSLAPVFAASTSARAQLTRTLQAASPGLGGFGPTFVDELLRLYGGEIDAALEQANARIAKAIEALRAQPSDQKQANVLAASLDLWSSLRRPIQVHEAARGLDDPASARLFDEVRRLTVSLSNDHEEYEIALRLARSLISSFALVPFHRNALERELPVLIGNALNRRLSQICDQSRADRAGFARSVRSGGLLRGSGLAGQLAATFVDALESTPESRASYFLIVRNLAIDLHNHHHDHRSALAITQWLAAHDPPDELRERLNQDLATLGAEPAPEPEDSEAGESVPVLFGRAGTRATAPAPPRPPTGRNERPAPFGTPETRAARKRKPGILYLIFLTVFATAYCTNRPARVARAPQPAESVIAGPKPSYSTAPSGGRERFEQRIRELEARAYNDRLRRLDSTEPSETTGSAALPARALGTPPRPSVSTAPTPPRRSGYSQGVGSR